MLLAHAGVIGHHPAGTHRSAWDDLAASGATVTRDRVVDDGDLVTAGGASGLDLALWMVERFGSVGAGEHGRPTRWSTARPAPPPLPTCSPDPGSGAPSRN